MSVYPGVYSKPKAAKEAPDSRLSALGAGAGKTPPAVSHPRRPVSGGIVGDVGFAALLQTLGGDYADTMFEDCDDADDHSDGDDDEFAPHTDQSRPPPAQPRVSQSSSSSAPHPTGPPLVPPPQAAPPSEVAPTLSSLPLLVPGPPGPRRAYANYDVYADDGSVVGFIKWNSNAESLDAHCSAHRGGRLNCVINRTTTDGSVRNRTSQGRPLGFLVAWLRCGGCFPTGPASRVAHFDARRGKGAFAHIGDGTSTARRAARAWLNSAPHMQTLLGCERARRPGEPDEPPDLP